MSDVVDQYFAGSSGTQAPPAPSGDVVDQYFQGRGQQPAPQPQGDVVDKYFQMRNPPAPQSQAPDGMFHIQTAAGTPVSLTPQQAQQYGQRLQPTQVLSPAQNMQQDNTQRGALSSNLIEALHPSAELYSQYIEKPVANMVQGLSPEMAQNIRDNAAQLQGVRGNGGISSIPGQVAGSLPTFLNPLTAAASAGTQTYSDVEQQKANGAKIGGLAEFADVAGQAALNATMARVFGGIPNTASKQIVPKLEGMVQDFLGQYAPQYIAKYGAKAAVGAVSNDIATMVGNALSKGTVNPAQKITEGLGTATAVGAALPVAMSPFVKEGNEAPPQIDPEQLKQLMLPDTGPAPKSAGTPVEQAGGLNLTAFQKMTEHTQGMLDALKELSGKQDQQIAGQENPQNFQMGKLNGAPEAPDAFKLMEQNRESRPPLSRDETPAPDAVKATLPPLLDNVNPKVRVSNGADNPSTGMTFENPYDKAAYIAGNARGGKLASAANDYLTSEGFTPDDIKQMSAKSQAMAQQVAGEGQTEVPDTLSPEIRQRAEAAKAAAAQSAGAAVQGTVVANTADDEKTEAGSTSPAGGLEPTSNNNRSAGINKIPELTARQINQKIMAQNTGDLDQEATRQLVGNGNYVLKQVPLEQLGPVFGKNGIDQTRVDKYASMPAEKQPPIVAGNVNGQLRPIDGKHRVMAAIQRGDSTIPAYVPKEGPESANAGGGSSQLSQGGQGGINVSPALKRRSGQVTMPDAVTNFVDQDVRPKLDAAVDGLKGSWDGFKDFFGMQSGKDAVSAKNTLRNRGAEMQQRVDSVRTALQSAKEYFDSQPQANTRQFIDDVENNRPVANPAEQPIADALRQLLDNRRDQLVKRDWLGSFIDNYFPHLWEEKEKATNVFSKSPMAGGSGFLRKRTFPTLQDGLNAGLTPLYENPVEAVMARVHQVDKFVTAHDAFDKMQNDGILKQVNATDPTADGYSRINDNIAKSFIKPTSKGGLNLAKRFDAPQAVASVINNYTDPGLRNKSGAFLLRSAIGASNVMNSVQLGLSPFHAVFTSGNAILTKLATGARQLMRADIPGAAKSMLTAPLAPMEYYKTGGKLTQEWMKPGSTDPQTAQYVNWLKQAGGRASLDSQYDNSFRAKFMTALKGGNPIGAAVRAPFAGLEAVASPIMDHLVPRMKLGAFLDEARQNLENLPDTASEQDRRSALGNAWDSVDNRFGQLTYDNIFWNKFAKDAGMASTRSLGWNLGTFRELGGGLGDIARGKLNTGRAVYTAMLPVFTAGLAAAGSKLLFGQNWSPTDPFTIHTGQKDQQGREITMSPSTYMKDVVGFMRHPLLTLEHKASPALSAAIELMENKDYRGAMIRNPDDPIETQLGQVGKYLGKEAVPFSVANATQNLGQGTDSRIAIGSMLGMTRNPAEWNESPAQRTVHEIMSAAHGDAAVTPEDEAKYQAESKLVDQMASAPASQRRPMAIQALHTGVLGSMEQVNRKLKDAQYGTQFERNIATLVGQGQKGVDNAFKVWDEANPDEQAKMKPIILKELNNSKTIPFSQKQIYRAKLSGKETADATQ